MSQRILITSALPYVNGVKHLGNLAGSLLPADVYARFERARRGKENVLAICATDEHGAPAELAALAAGMSVEAYCAHWSARQKEIGDQWHLSWDHWGRSSSEQNRKLTQHFAGLLWRHGYLDVRTTRQVYSHSDKRFLQDRYVIGTCPHCGYERATGDQCENCTRVLDPSDLIRPRSALSGSNDIEIRDSKHIFLKQSLFIDELRALTDAREKTGDWVPLVVSIARKWLDEGLKDRGITRDLEWGVPLNVAEWGPNPEGERLDPEDFAGKRFYVWFDAPIEYIGATREWSDANPSLGGWERWWRSDKGAQDVRYVQFMGKDNVPFHAVGFPVTLLGSREPWKVVDVIKGFNWLNYDGGKFSTSQKRGVFMDQALEVQPADCWRYYLMANAPEGSDTNFTWDHFAGVVNKDLNDVLGNFVSRCLKFAAARFDGVVPEGGQAGPAEDALIQDLTALTSQYTANLSQLQFRKAFGDLRAIWVKGNEYLANAAPWTTIKTDPAAAAVSIRTGVNLIRLFALLSAPVIPATAQRMLHALNLAEAAHWPSQDITAELAALKPGHAFQVPGNLFEKIDAPKIAEWTARFGGQQL
ncbi:MAG TPA: methionine--tRNA ligase [Alphaproteobacteria bacterium]|nr:methionine--tRNA ligase [Alphaproteobacteria bacterium]HAJ45312.1 methionine--tRNA ligase [Alphaproteobacteria bacterium]